MLSLPLAAALVDALRPGCQLVLVGDVDQLPAVGPGSVLRALIDSRLVPVVDLREVFRQAAQSAIVTSALAVRRGDVPRLAEVAPTPAGFRAAASDALLVRAPSPAALPATVQQVVVALRGAAAISGRPAPDLQVRFGRPGPACVAGCQSANPMWHWPLGRWL